MSFTYIPGFVREPDAAFAQLRDELAWVRRTLVPRCEYYCNDFPEPCAEREIWVRPNLDPQRVMKVLLEHGSAFVMHRGTQDTHQHRIPKASRACGERISLTFRGYLRGKS